MIFEVETKLRRKLLPMFESINSTIVLSCLQGHMGKVWVDDMDNPTVGQVVVGIFVFFVGNPHAKEADELLNNLPEFTLAIVNTDEWKKRIETFYKNGRVEKFQRYSFIKDSEHLDREHLKRFLDKLPQGYQLQKIDASLANEPSFQELSEDFINQYGCVDNYLEKGVGYGILYDGKVVCGASSYSVYDDGIEIEIATHPDHRKKGLATIAASALMLDCLNSGKYPSWEAANLESVALAQKLGYVLDSPYDTYYIEIGN